MQTTDMLHNCMNHLHRYVLVTLSDGRTIDGIVENVDPDYVYLAVPSGEGTHSFSPSQPDSIPHPTNHSLYGSLREGDSTEESETSAQEETRGNEEERLYYYPPAFGGFYGGYSYPYPWYGYAGPWYGYPYHYPYPRRFRRVVFPLAALTALSLLPYY